MNGIRTFWRWLTTGWRWFHWVLALVSASTFFVCGVAATLAGILIAIGPGRDPNLFTYTNPLLFWLAIILGGPLAAFVCARGIRELWRIRPWRRRSAWWPWV